MNAVNEKNFGGEFVAKLDEVGQILMEIEPLAQSQANFLATCQIAAEDVDTACKFFSSDHTMFWRRTIIKNVVSFLEAFAYGLKQMTLRYNDHFQNTLTAGEISLLKEEKYFLDKSGRLQTDSKNYQKFLPNLQFALNCFAKFHGVTLSLDESLRNALFQLEDVRNRLTHPKKAKEMSVCDTELSVCKRVHDGVFQHCRELGKSCDIERLALNENLFRFRTRLSLKPHLPWVVYCRDGTVYQFSREPDAKAFADAKEIGLETLINVQIFALNEVRPRKEAEAYCAWAPAPLPPA